MRGCLKTLGVHFCSRRSRRRLTRSLSVCTHRELVSVWRLACVGATSSLCMFASVSSEAGPSAPSDVPVASVGHLSSKSLSRRCLSSETTRRSMPQARREHISCGHFCACLAACPVSTACARWPAHTLSTKGFRSSGELARRGFVAPEDQSILISR